MENIMVIEDNENIRNELVGFLNRYGYKAYGAEDFENIIEEIKNKKPHLILLDINLPMYDGYYICREIRKDSNIPIIMVTSRDSDMDELMSMNVGADDFITKPYNTQILLARIASVLRRVYSNNNTEDVMEHRGLNFNLANGTIEFNNKSMELTKNELKILTCLLKNKNKIVSREDLMDFLWNSDLYVDDNTLSVNITRLRKKLNEIGFENAIETKRGLGYILI